MTLCAKEFRGHVEHVVNQFSAPHNLVNFDTLCALWEPAVTSGAGKAYANPDGFLLAWFIIDPISGERTAAQQLWMQAPSYRSNRAALNLFFEFEADAKAWGAQRIVSGCVVISDIPKMRRLYKKLGYRPFSETFCKVL